MNRQRYITIKIRKIYGMPVIYPADPDARSFAAIANTKTITPQAIQHIKNLGFDVNEQPETTLKDIIK